MPSTKYTRAELKNQLTYGKWVYFAVALVAIGLAEILYTATAYHAPNARPVDVELSGGYADTASYELYTPALLAAGQAYERARDEAAGIDTSAAEYEVPLQEVEIYNITNGERFATYAIRGERGTGVIGINGAAAHKAMVGHLLIIAAYAQMDFEEAKQWHPTVIFPKNNRL